MAQSHFSLTWDAHKENVSLGLSSLQQNSEFVDMTVAADGHFVKVHKVVVALASPYIKELINSMECSHPVIYLNKISYKTLCLMLEYMYTGEVVVTLEELYPFAQAAKDLCIKGLENMKLFDLLNKEVITEHTQKIQDLDHTDHKRDLNESEAPETEDAHELWLTDNEINQSMDLEENEPDHKHFEDYEVLENIEEKATTDNVVSNNLMQYTVSNQGSLQMILNRYIYYLKYTTRSNTRQWRCVNYLSPEIKCPAQVVTKNNVVTSRKAIHKHPFHDNKILKKVRDAAIFTALSEAEEESFKRAARAKKIQDATESKAKHRRAGDSGRSEEESEMPLPKDAE